MVRLHCELLGLPPLGNGELLLGDHWYCWVVCDAAGLLGHCFSPESLVLLSSWNIKRASVLQGVGRIGLSHKNLTTSCTNKPKVYYLIQTVASNKSVPINNYFFFFFFPSWFLGMN